MSDIVFGVPELFDGIYCDDGIIPTKSSSAAVEDSILKSGIDRHGIVMAGDTETDINFTKAEGIHMVSLAELLRHPI